MEAGCALNAVSTRVKSLTSGRKDNMTCINCDNTKDVIDREKVKTKTLPEEVAIKSFDKPGYGYMFCNEGYTFGLYNSRLKQAIYFEKLCCQKYKCSENHRVVL